MEPDDLAAWPDDQVNQLMDYHEDTVLFAQAYDEIEIQPRLRLCKDLSKDLFRVLCGCLKDSRAHQINSLTMNAVAKWKRKHQ